MKKKMTFKEWMRQPYTKGDYYGGIVAMLGLYGLIIGGYVLYNKLTDNEAVTLGKELSVDSVNMIRKAYMDEIKEDEA